ncbi:unnamed protein product [Calicophoron daubneyi]|uniref:5'-tyrosyl-DNA phosphodiesterase n=1 Tax=Calicophoron daubneyi TaxID=300641 RepID=A0AAV2TN28_CALDB
MEVDAAQGGKRDPFLEKCARFTEITGTNNALAMLYLQDRGWDLERSISDYFNDQGRNKKRPREILIDLTGTDEKLPLTESALTADSHPPSPSPPADYEQRVFNVLSWNIEGLNRFNLINRTNAVISCIRSDWPHIVCLQEVVPETLELFKSSLKESYHTFGATDDPFADCAHYFVAILVRRHNAIELDSRSFTVYPFPGSQMARHLLSVDIILHPSRLHSKPGNSQPTQSDQNGKNLRVRIYTSHLESCYEGMTERKSQLQCAWKKMKEIKNSSSSSYLNSTSPNAAIFCGDLNLRDNEVTQLGGVPTGIVDVWEATGSRTELHATWNPRLNLNAAGLSKSRRAFRYDRMYLSGECLKPVDFGFRGLEKVRNTSCHPSDHWGILGRFAVT